MSSEQATKKDEKKKKGRGKIIALLVLTLLLGGGAATGAYFIWDNAGHLSTDNARVTTRQIHIMPPIPGVLERFNIYEGRYVEQNEILGWVENGEAMRAPVGGLVIYTGARQGEMVSPQRHIAVIADTANIHIQANIEETDITKVHLGQRAYVTIDPFGSRQFAGHVTDIARVTTAELAGQALFFNTGGQFTRVTHHIPIEITLEDDVVLDNFIGVNARVRIPLR